MQTKNSIKKRLKKLGRREKEHCCLSINFLIFLVHTNSQNFKIVIFITGPLEIMASSKGSSKDVADGENQNLLGGAQKTTVVDGIDTLINFENDNELSSSSFSSSYSGDLLHFQNASDDLI